MNLEALENITSALFNFGHAILGEKETLQEKNDHLLKENADLISDKTSLKTQMQEMAKEKADLRKNLQGVTLENETLQQEINVMKENTDTLLTKKTAMEQKMHKLSSQNAQIKDNLEKKCAELTKQCKSVSNQNEALQQKYNTLMKVNEDLLKDKAALQVSIGQLFSQSTGMRSNHPLVPDSPSNEPQRALEHQGDTRPSGKNLKRAYARSEYLDGPSASFNTGS